MTTQAEQVEQAEQPRFQGDELQEWLDGIELRYGGHAVVSGFCVMEAVAYVAGEPWSDHPECASPVIGQFLRSWNDAMSTADRQMLKPYIPRLVGTRAGKAIELRRAWTALDWYRMIALTESGVR